MRLRFWIGMAAVLLLGVGSVLAAALVYVSDRDQFHDTQREEATRAAHQTEAMAALSVGQLGTAAAYSQAENKLNGHDFGIVGRALLRQGVLNATGFLQKVPNSARSRFEDEHGVRIFERAPSGLLRRAGVRPVYYPVTYVVARADPTRAIGYDLGSDPERRPYLERARDTGEAIASPVGRLVLGGSGIVVFQPIYRDGAPTATVAERRRALIGFAAGSFRLDDLASTAVSSLSGDTEVQLRVGKEVVVGPDGELEDAAAAPVDIADRTWLLVVRDPDQPDLALPLLLAIVGIALAAMLGVLNFLWSRNERMRELQMQASHDSLTGLKNRRRFEEELRVVMARSRREGTTGALLMIDIDHFKQVNDSFGHPAGDKAIVEIAGVLRRRTRESDILARLGGDEFALVLPRSSVTEARVVAEAVVEAIRSYEPEDKRLESVTASVGVAMFGGGIRVSQTTLISEADTAMYAAKDGGRDGVRVFHPGAISEEAPGATPA